jgi:diguanylate cyclase (GGDEF)-like protein
MGGDEFLALLPNTAATTAKEIAEKLHRAIADLRIVHGSAVVSVSASLGCAEVEGPGDWGYLLIQSDRQLYQEKDKRYRQGGRRSGERAAIPAQGYEEERQEIPHGSQLS